MRAEYLIETYFSKGLSANEQKELEDLLGKDEKLKSEFNFQLEVRAAIRQKEHKKLKEKLRRIELESPSNGGVKWLAIAASIIILLGLTWYFGLNSKQDAYNGLYLAHFDVYPNVVAPIERSDESESSPLRKEAFSQYEHGEYEAAYTSFQKLYDQDSSEFAGFYGAVSLMANGKYDGAISHFESVQNWENPDFEVASKWYLALAYLKRGDKNTATNYLKEVQESDHGLRREADKLLKELNTN